MLLIEWLELRAGKEGFAVWELTNHYPGSLGVELQAGGGFRWQFKGKPCSRKDAAWYACGALAPKDAAVRPKSQRT